MSEELTVQKIDALADAVAAIHITASLHSGVLYVKADGRAKPQIHLAEEEFMRLFEGADSVPYDGGRWDKLSVQRGPLAAPVEVFCLVQRAKVTA